MLADNIATRWALRAFIGDFRPSLARGVATWVERESGRSLTAKDYMRELEQQRELEQLQLNKPESTFTPQTTPEEDVFADAKASIEAMLPKFTAALTKKFRDRFYMRATQQRLKLYYYFSGHPALETIALSLTLKGGKPMLWLGYIPNKLLGGADFAKSAQEQVVVSDPEMAGLALMRLVRSLLAKVP